MTLVLRRFARYNGLEDLPPAHARHITYRLF